MLAHALWCTKNLKGGWDGCSLLAEKRERLASCKKSVIIMAGKNEFISGSKKALYTIIRPSILVAETLSLFHFHTSFCATWVFDLENSCSFNERVGRPPLVPGPSSTEMTDAVKPTRTSVATPPRVCLEKVKSYHQAAMC